MLLKVLGEEETKEGYIIEHQTKLVVIQQICYNNDTIRVGEHDSREAKNTSMARLKISSIYSKSICD